MSAYAPIARTKLYGMPPDFFARRTHFVDHLAPIWNELNGHKEKGIFYVPRYLYEYARDRGLKVQAIPPRAGRKDINVRPPGNGPLVACAYNDMEQGYLSYAQRPLILMEHGVGLSFGHPGYGGGIGLRKRVCLFLAPNQNIYNKTSGVFPEAPQVIIGTPKMDAYQPVMPVKKENPVIGISFHWNGKHVCPEAGNALDHYLEILPELAARFTLVGHGHPKIIDKLIPIYQNCGITTIERDFSKVLEMCDIYINDASSTLYEFSCTGKPVIILNAPWFRRDVHHGIRFWQYTDIGVNVDDPVQLVPAVKKTIAHPAQFYKQRLKMVEDLYPYIGCSAKRAAQAITTFLRSKYNGTAFDSEQISGTLRAAIRS